MTEKKSVSNPGFSADWFLQGALTKIGDTLDRFTGRKWTPSSSLATSELVERMKRLLDSEARDVPGKGLVVPHNIKLKVQWDKFSTDSEETLQKLENELLTAAADHVNDQLYFTIAPLAVEVKPDYFTEGVKLFVSFDKFVDEDNEAQLNVTLPSINIASAIPEPAATNQQEHVFIARFEIAGTRRDRRLVFGTATRKSVGRTTANDLTIDDPSVSKIHASLVLGSDLSLSVADTGSTNGTFVNGERISYGKSVKLATSDVVRFGMVDVVFEHITDRPDDSRPATPSQESTFRSDGSQFSDAVPDSKSTATEPEKTVEIEPVLSGFETRIDEEVK